MSFRHYIFIGMAVLTLVGSFLLPNAVASITDARRLDNFTMIDSQRISFDAAPDLALHERLALVASSNTEILPLNTGNALNAETAGEAAVREVARFFSNSNFSMNYHELTANEGIASLVIDVNAPTRNMVVWEIEVFDQGRNSTTVTIDDETGMIVRLIYRLGYSGGYLIESGITTGADEMFFRAAQELAALMTEYYGMHIIIADYQFSNRLSYYRADIFAAGVVVPMFGVVRATSFTMNERV